MMRVRSATVLFGGDAGPLGCRDEVRVEHRAADRASALETAWPDWRVAPRPARPRPGRERLELPERRRAVAAWRRGFHHRPSAMKERLALCLIEDVLNSAHSELFLRYDVRMRGDLADRQIELVLQVTHGVDGAIDVFAARARARPRQMPPRST